MKRLQILQVCHDYEGPFSHICRQYVSGFENHHVTTVFLKGPHSDDVCARIGGEVIFFEQGKVSLRGIKVGSILQMARLFRHQRFDVVLAHRYKAIYLAGIMSYFFPVPLIIAIAHEHEVFQRITRKLFVTFWRKNILIVAVSESVKQNIARYCSSLISQNRLFTLPNAIDIGQEGKLLRRDQARSQLRLGENEFVIGTIGRLVAKKNHEVLIRALAELADPNCRLVIIGDGPRRKSLQLLAENLGVLQRIEFAGFKEDANRLVKALDLFVLPSGNEEAFGIVLLEAMLGKVPILASNAPGPKEVLADTGVLFKSGESQDLADKLKLVMQRSSAERLQMAEKGYQRMAEHYGYDSFKRRLWRLPGLQQLLTS